MKNTTFNNFVNRIPFYILLIGLYPVLFLWMANFTKIHSYVVPRSLLISAGFSLFVFLLSWLLVRSLPRAGLISGLWLILFYSYGHIFSQIDNTSLFGTIYGRHRFMIPVWVVLGIIGTITVLRSRSDLRQATRSANLIFFLLTAFVLIQIGISAASMISITGSAAGKIQINENVSQSSSGMQRDIYYILIDGYDRPDLMLKDLELDVYPFVDQLKELGFIIPACGMSNFTDTAQSMAATFNMEYLDNLGVSYQEIATSDHEKLLTPYITHSIVREKFESLGYQWITYKSPYLFIDMPDSDIYLDAETATNPGEKLETLNFQQLFINTTFARTATEWLEENPKDSSRLPTFFVWLISPGSLNPDSSTFAGRNYKQYRMNLFQLETLENMPERPGKKFVYNHLLVTHQPFTFTATGEFRTEGKDSYESYKDQIRYINTRLIDIIQTILEKSDVPPVIIIQSDHSYSDGGKRAQNFQAYYLPESGNIEIPDSFTNVNTFRLILTNYFNEDYPLLTDLAFLVDKKYDGYIKTIPPVCQEK